MFHILVGGGCVQVCTVETPTLHSFSILLHVNDTSVKLI